MENKKSNISKTKKKKLSLKKIKKIFVNIGRKIVKYVKSLWEKFMALPRNTRYIVYVWGVVFLVIVFLIAISRGNNIFLEDYQNLEKAMNVGALDYVETYSLYPVKGNKLKLDLEFLEENNYVYSEDIKDKTCAGFSLVHFDDEEEKYVISSYINCDKYTTEGYSDYK